MGETGAGGTGFMEDFAAGVGQGDRGDKEDEEDREEGLGHQKLFS